MISEFPQFHVFYCVFLCFFYYFTGGCQCIATLLISIVQLYVFLHYEHKWWWCGDGDDDDDDDVDALFQLSSCRLCDKNADATACHRQTSGEWHHVHQQCLQRAAHNSSGPNSEPSGTEKKRYYRSLPVKQFTSITSCFTGNDRQCQKQPSYQADNGRHLFPVCSDRVAALWGNNCTARSVNAP